MPMDPIFDQTVTLLAVIDNTPPANTFLRDRYCPTGQVFTTEEVLVEYRDGKKRLAPMVHSRMGSVQVGRDGFDAQKFAPPFFAPHRTITPDTLKRKQLGEALYRDRTPEMRRRILITQDMVELREMHLRREEHLASRLMQDGKIELMEYLEDKATGNVVTLDYYTPTSWAFLKSWSDPTANILGDIDSMADERKAKSLAAKELVVSPEVCEHIIRNDDVYRFLDNQRFQMGNIAPEELPDGVSRVGVARTFKGRLITIFSYEEKYTADDGTDTPYIDPGKVILTAPNMGHTNYGSITQMERDEETYTRAGRHVPRLLANVRNDSTELRLASAPLPIPNAKFAFTPAEVIF